MATRGRWDHSCISFMGWQDQHQYLLPWSPITDVDFQWDEKNFRKLTGMELRGKEKKFPELLWTGYISAVVSDLVSDAVER